jgi:hypothetical protein
VKDGDCIGGYTTA